MSFVIQNVTPSPISFGDDSTFFIISHKTVNEQLYFRYRIGLIYNSNIQYDPNLSLQVRVVESQKRLQAQQITKRDMMNGNAIKIIGDRPLQSFETKLSPLVILNIPRVDLNKSELTYDVDIPASLIKNQIMFQIVQVDVKNTEFISTSAVIDHTSKLQSYDVPGSNFALRSGFLDDNTIVIEASTFDNKIGAFNFFVKNETPIDVRPTFYEFIGTANLDYNKIAKITHNIEEGQKLKFAAAPASKFVGKIMSNTSEVLIGSSYTNVFFPFYVSGISDTSVTFNIKDVPSKIKKIMLYRQIFGQKERQFIADARVFQGDVRIEDDERLTQYDTVYTLDYIDENSALNTSSNALFLPSLKLNTLASVTATLMEQTTRQDNVVSKFKVSVNYNNTSSFDQIVGDLKKVGLDNLFDEDLKKMTSNLKPLIRVLVSRINLETGEVQELDIVEPGEVTYTNTTQTNFLYRFEAAIRSAPELMENLASSQNVLANISRDSRDIIDTVSKTISTRFKAQASFTAKFLSKTSLRGSMLKYGNAASGIDLGFHAGRTGIFADITIPKIQSQITIKDVKVQKFQDSQLLTWSFTGSPHYFNVSHGGLTNTAVIIPGQTQCNFYLDKTTTGQIVLSAYPESENQNTSVTLEIM